MYYNDQRHVGEDLSRGETNGEDVLEPIEATELDSGRDSKLLEPLGFDVVLVLFALHRRVPV